MRLKSTIFKPLGTRFYRGTLTWKHNNLFSTAVHFSFRFWSAVSSRSGHYIRPNIHTKAWHLSLKELSAALQSFMTMTSKTMMQRGFGKKTGRGIGIGISEVVRRKVNLMSWLDKIDAQSVYQGNQEWIILLCMIQVQGLCKEVSARARKRGGRRALEQWCANRSTKV